jgi:RNase H-like domain found in reverse transcriptase/Reverse transcriptase (RNA-dependent DNA polymerase)/Integrase zinc binding domain/Integrase core domain
MRLATFSCHGQPDLTFIVDTGAEVSCVNSRSLVVGTPYRPDLAITVSGIDGIPTKTTGLVILELVVGTVPYSQFFQVVPSKLVIQYDGLLGIDFLSRYTILDFFKNVMSFPHVSVDVPLISTLRADPSHPGTQPVALGSSDHAEVTPELIPESSFTQPLPCGIPNKLRIDLQPTLAVQDRNDHARCPLGTNRQPTDPPQAKDSAARNPQTLGPLEEQPCPTGEPLPHSFPRNEPGPLTKLELEHPLDHEDSDPEIEKELSQFAWGDPLITFLKGPNDPLDASPSEFRLTRLRDDRLTARPRHERILESLDVSNLGNGEGQAAREIIRDFSDIFHLNGDSLTFTPTIQHHIRLSNPEPIHVRQYRTPYRLQGEVARQVDELLQDGLVQPSRSPYNFPLLIVSKKAGADGDKRYRLCVDFRKLNEATISDLYPLPHISEILDKIGSAKYFSTYDLKAGFHQIEVAPECRHLLAFQGANTHLEYRRMPFGLKNAPATMQRLMNEVLSGIKGGATPQPNLKAFVFMDDIVQYADSLEEMAGITRKLFALLRSHRLKIQPEKCQLFRKEVTFLGHVVKCGSIEPCVDKIQAILNFPKLQRVKDVQSFLGLANYYRRFIQKFAEHAEPLINLTRKNVEFIWDEQCEKSFQHLKQALTHSPVMSSFDPQRPIVITTDASAYALGAQLSQVDSEGNEKPVAYASRRLIPAERNYSTFERELLAVLWALEHFHVYALLNPVIIYTDHKPLVALKTKQIQGSDRLVRWRLRLEVYDYSIQYRPGKENLCADALSRLVEERKDKVYQFLFEDGPRPEEDFVRTESLYTLHHQVTANSRTGTWKKSTSCCPAPGNLNAVTRAQAAQISVTNPEDAPQDLEPPQPLRSSRPADPPDPEFVLDPDRQKEIIKEFHDSPLGGHQGVKRTWNRIRPLFKWPRMHASIEEYISTCPSCQRNKTLRHTKMPMVIVSTATRPFEKVYLDIVGGKGSLPTTTSGNKYILTFQDDLSKFSEAIPIASQDAPTVARAFVDGIVLRHGMPKSLLTDQGANFMSNLFKNTCKLLKIKKLNTTPYHPQTNGALERSHKGLAEYLRSFVNSDQNNWDEWVGYAIFTYNTTPHSTTGYSPFELVYGRKAEVPSALTREPEPLYNFDDYNLELKYRLNTSHAIAREKIAKAKATNKRLYDQSSHAPTFNVGEWVLMKKASRENKLDSVYEGPYKITEITGPVNCKIRKRKRDICVHFNLLIPYHERVSGTDSDSD